MEEQIREIAVLNYSLDPGPRYIRQGDDSGEDYYHKILNFEFYNAIIENKKLRVSLDGTSGYASSFLDEAFGNLVYDFTLDLVKRNLIIQSEEEPEWIEMLESESFVEWEQRRIEEKEATKSENHPDWYRFINGNFSKNAWIKVS